MSGKDTYMSNTRKKPTLAKAKKLTDPPAALKVSYSTTEAEEATGYSRHTLRKAIQNGELEAKLASTNKSIITGPALWDWLQRMPSNITDTGEEI